MIQDIFAILCATQAEVHLEDAEKGITLASIGTKISASANVSGSAKSSMKLTSEKFAQVTSAMSGFTRINVSGGKFTLKNDDSTSVRVFTSEKSSGVPAVELSGANMSEPVEIDTAEFSSAAGVAAQFCDSKDDYVTGFVWCDKGIVAGTNRYVIFASRTDAKMSGLIHPSQVKLFATMKKIDRTVKLYDSKAAWVVEGTSYIVRFSKPLMEMPDFTKIITRGGVFTSQLEVGTQTAVAPISIDFDELKDAVSKCLDVFSAKEYAYAELIGDGKGKMRVDAISQTGDSFFAIIKYNGPAFKAKVNPQYYMKAISSLPGCKTLFVDGESYSFFTNGKGRVVVLAPKLSEVSDSRAPESKEPK